MTDINNGLLQKIDELQLSNRIRQWKQAVNSSGWRLVADREKWTVESWHEIEGEDIEIRRAKLLKNILKNIRISL
ncbi:MAG: hypothetical protein PVG39_28890 [Desulfobacteraceae bacterium]